MSWQIATILVGGVATIAIFSFLYRENPLFRFFEHLYIGIAAGLGVVLTVKEFFWPKIFTPMLGLDIITYPDQTVSETLNPAVYLYLLPMAFGLLYYFIFSARYSWLAKLVIGFSLGMSGGLAFKGFFNEMVPQILGSFKPLVVFGADGVLLWGRSASNTIFVLTLLCVMSYFFFSFRKAAALRSSTAGVGRWLMMVCFGAFFGSTVMARMALLVERLQFLLVDWASAVGGLFHS